MHGAQDGRNRLEALNDQAVASYNAYLTTGNLDSLTESCRLLESVVDAAPGEARYLSNLGNVLRTLYGRTRDPEMLEGAIEVGRAAVEATPSGDPSLAGHLSNLSLALTFSFQRTGDLETLADAAETARAAVAAAPEGHPQRAGTLSNLGRTLHNLAVQSGDIDILLEAVAVCHEAAAVPSDRLHAPAILFELGCALGTLFECTDDLAVLAEAVATFRTCVDSRPAEHPAQIQPLTYLANTLTTTYERTGDLDALGEAVSARRALLALTPDDDPKRAERLSDLGVALRLQAEAGR